MYRQLKKNLFKAKILGRLPFSEKTKRDVLYSGMPWPGNAALAVAISFDIDYMEDEAALTPVIELLQINDCPASFACIGAMVEQRSGCYRLLPELGYEIINHSMNHPYHRVIYPDERWMNLSEEKIKNEIINCHDIIRTKLGYTCKGFRTPHFEFRNDIMPVLKELNYAYDSSGFYSEKEIAGSLPPLIDGFLEIPIYREASSYRCVREQHLTDIQWSSKLEDILQYEASIGGMASFYFDPQDIPARPWVLQKLIKTARENNAWLATYAEIAGHITAL